MAADFAVPVSKEEGKARVANLMAMTSISWGITSLIAGAGSDRWGRRPFLIPTGARDEIGVWGYVAASGELVMDFASNAIEPHHLVLATGLGGTQAGLPAGLRALG